MEQSFAIAGRSTSDNKDSLEEFPVSSGGLYTLADILTSINKKQSKVTPSMIRKKMLDDPESKEWKEYQAKRLQALKILKQEKEHRLKEEMRRLGLKTVTPDLRSRLEAQFQYLHEALLPDSGLEEEQEAAARAIRAGKKKSKKSTSVHWSQDVMENDKRTKSKSSTKVSNKISTKNASKNKSNSSKGSQKSNNILSVSGSKASSGKKRSLSLTRISSIKSKGKKPGKAASENKSFDNEMQRLETIEAGAKSLLHELSGQFGSLDKSSVPSVSQNNASKSGVLSELGLDKIRSKLVSSPKMKAPSQVNTNTKTPLSKSKPRSISLGRLKVSKGSKPMIQSSGYGQQGVQKRDTVKVNLIHPTKKGGKALENKNTAIFRKAAAQHNAIADMKEILDMKIPKKVFRSKSEVANTPKLKATPIISNKANKIVTAGKSKSSVVAGTSVAAKSKVIVKDKVKLLTQTPATTNVFNPKPISTQSFKAAKSKSMDVTLPAGNTTVIAELYPVNSKIAAAVDSDIDKGSVKSDADGAATNKAKSIPKEKSENGLENSELSKNIRPAQRKPPKFPTVDLCNVFPGTHEWDLYWEKFNVQITTYYAEMDDYLKSMNDFTMDLDDYSKELKKIQMGNQAFAMKLGLNPNYKSTPSIAPKVPPSMQFTNTPLEPGVYNINGYIIKSGGGRIPGLRLTTVAEDGFSLELDLAEIDIDPQLITVETEFNVMTITVPVKTELGRVRIIQIRVPSRSNVNDLSLREVQRSSKKGVKSRVLLITGD